MVAIGGMAPAALPGTAHGEHPRRVSVPCLLLSILATLLSAAFFVGGKVVLARRLMPWTSLWAWQLAATGAIGAVVWLALGAPSAPWGWMLAAGLSGAAAHIAANLALRWGDASLTVPLSGAKPLALLALAPLFTGAAVPPALAYACWLATLGIALGTLAPRRRHEHARRPGTSVLLMVVAVVLMALSDLFGNEGLRAAGPDGRWAAIAAWNMALGLAPVLWLLAARPATPPRALGAAAGLGALFAVFIAVLAAALAAAPDPARAVPVVNVVIACRGVAAIAMVVALDRWLGQGLEPIPRWVQGMRLAGALVLALAVALAMAG